MSCLRKAGVAMLKCDHNCLHCPYSEMPEECLNEDAVYSEYEDFSRIEKELLFPNLNGSKTKSDRSKYLEREKKKRYRKRHPEKVNEHHLRWYRKNRDRVAAYAKEYIERNIKQLSYQFCIKNVRTAHGMSQKDLANKVGVSVSTVSRWENGVHPANWDKLCAVLPDLDRYKERVL